MEKRSHYATSLEGKKARRVIVVSSDTHLRRVALTVGRYFGAKLSNSCTVRFHPG